MIYSLLNPAPGFKRFSAPPSSFRAARRGRWCNVVLPLRTAEPQPARRQQVQVTQHPLLSVWWARACWWSEIGSAGSVYTMDMNKHYESGLFFVVRLGEPPVKNLSPPKRSWGSLLGASARRVGSVSQAA